jgi:hypothetical protein
LNIAAARLWNQQISAQRFARAEELVAWLGAVQAQDFTGAKWSLGLRLPEATEADVEKAIAQKRIVRTWPMRGTLHIVAAADVHWMRDLLTPHIVAASAKRHAELGLNAAELARCEKIFTKALRGGRQLTRDGMCGLLEDAGIAASGPRRYHILWRLAQEGLLCFGTHEGKQPTFALLDEWCPGGKKKDREEALAELARRYFTGHGPATIRDFTWWSGLKAADARAALALAAPVLEQVKIGEQIYWMAENGPSKPKASRNVFLLPGFDEYLLGYTDRSAVLDLKYAQRICPGSNGMFIPTVVMGGRVAGIWKRVLKRDTVLIQVKAFTSFKKAEKQAIEEAAERYGTFVGKKAMVEKSVS